ncbi:hypothetical protein F3J40_20905 [Pantoea sp. Acro-835]|uniref:Uncharacterized protein n=1 Tax=Candidatus Pantoea multigeneris TaxID=2608357 RepID=A0ABX0RFC1_9GAMM|nr:hypothetical protein [Pantoea multigeneris]
MPTRQPGHRQRMQGRPRGRSANAAEGGSWTAERRNLRRSATGRCRPLPVRTGERDGYANPCLRCGRATVKARHRPSRAHSPVPPGGGINSGTA